jgi:apolipoprotein N-acyltransferase
MTTNATPVETSFERIVSALMVVVFWIAFSALGAGLGLWLATSATDTGDVAMAAGLLGLLLMPILRVVWAMATAVARRDWLMLGATVAVLVILIALTLRDAATLEQ